MIEECFDRARGMFRPHRRYFRPRSRYASTVLEVCFDSARGMFGPHSTTIEIISIVLGVCCDCTRGVFRQCSKYVLTALEVCFDRARIIFDHAQGLFPSFSWHFSTMPLTSQEYQYILDLLRLVHIRVR